MKTLNERPSFWRNSILAALAMAGAFASAQEASDPVRIELINGHYRVAGKTTPVVLFVLRLATTPSSGE